MHCAKPTREPVAIHPVAVDAVALPPLNTLRSSAPHGGDAQGRTRDARSSGPMAIRMQEHIHTQANTHTINYIGACTHLRKMSHAPDGVPMCAWILQDVCTAPSTGTVGTCLHVLTQQLILSRIGLARGTAQVKATKTGRSASHRRGFGVFGGAVCAVIRRPDGRGIGALLRRRAVAQEYGC